MLNARAALAVRSSLPGEAFRFLLVGLTAVAIDFAVYKSLLFVGLAVSPSKAISFIVGAVFSYFSNRAVTFRAAGPRTIREFARFACVYGTTLVANVGVNHLTLTVLGHGRGALEVAFLSATAVSATLNFVGMKVLVFRNAAGISAPRTRQRVSVIEPGGRNDGLRLSLVIPCYNEAANLPLLIARLREVLVSDDIEAILVDNGSTDDSPVVLAALLGNTNRIRSVRVERNQGYGFGILTGLRAARGRILGWTHADMQTDPADALKALALCEGHARFVKGRRLGRPMGDVVFTVGMSAFETLLLRQPLWDINAQPTLMPRAFFETWTDPPHDFSIDLYAYYGARATGLPVARFPVHFGARAHGTSKWNVDWRAKLHFIRRTVDFSFRLARSL